MGLTHRLHSAWQALQASAPIPAIQPKSRTRALPSILSPFTGSNPQNGVPKPTAANLRRFAETPVARRAINLVKDRISSMDWQVRVRRGCDPAAIPDVAAKLDALRLALEEPNPNDSFRTLFEQAIEDTLVGGYGAIEMRPTGDPSRPFQLWAIDGASVQIEAKWQGDLDTPRYGFLTGQNGGQLGSAAVTPLRDDELMYIRLNPRTHTPFGLGRLGGRLRKHRPAAQRLPLRRAPRLQLRRPVRALARRSDPRAA